MNNPIITLEGVVKRFGNNVVVKNMNLEIAEGEFLTLLGPSGCGKTTTLRMIAGFEEASEGIKADFMLLGLKYEKKDAIHQEEK